MTIHRFGVATHPVNWRSQLRISYLLLTLALLCVTACTTTVPKPVSQPRPIYADFAGAKMTAAECEVWDREREFARSVELHDLEGFSDFIARDAIFDAGTAHALRGRDTVVKEWTGIVDGTLLELNWWPGVVSIGDDPNVAFSAGPAWLRTIVDGKPQGWRIGSFVSIWGRDDDGKWRVRFDRSGERAKPATLGEVETLKAALMLNCPKK